MKYCPNEVPRTLRKADNLRARMMPTKNCGCAAADGLSDSNDGTYRYQNDPYAPVRALGRRKPFLDREISFPNYR